MSKSKPTVAESQIEDPHPRIKLTREEMEAIQTIQTNMRNVTFDLGSIEIQLLSLDKNKKAILSKLDEINEHENTFAKELFDKYGKGSIDLEKGEFIKDTSDQ